MPAEVVADEQQVDEQQQSGNRGWAWVLVVGSAIGFLASMILTIDRIKLLTDPQAVLVCDISPFVTCGPVMSSAAGALFGFPNPLLGIAGFAIAGTTGMVLLAGARLARWYLVCFEVGCLARRGLHHLAADPEPVRDRGAVHLVHVRVGGDHPDRGGHHRAT